MHGCNTLRLYPRSRVVINNKPLATMINFPSLVVIMNTSLHAQVYMITVTYYVQSNCRIGASAECHMFSEIWFP